MNTTEEIEKWIAEYGNVRDALNVAITRLRQAEERIADLVDEIERMGEETLEEMQRDSLRNEEEN